MYPDDAEKQDATRARVQQAFADRDNAKQFDRKQTLDQAFEIAQKNGGSIDAVPPQMIARLGTMKVDLDRLLKADMNADPDPKTYYRLQHMAKEDPAAFKRENILEYRAQLGNKFQHFVDLHADIDKNGRASDPKLSSTISFQDRVENTLRAQKIIPANKAKSKLSKEEATTAIRFETEAAKQIEEFELNDLGGKRKATGQETQKIIDDLTIKKVFIEKWGRDPEKPIGALTPEERQTAYVPAASIPQDARQKIVSKMQALGVRASDQQIGRAYAAYQMGDRALFNSIVSGK
jgi:hypothetical protein